MEWYRGIKPVSVKRRAVFILEAFTIKSYLDREATVVNLHWQDFFARRTERVTGSQIRQFFALTERPEIISFAGI